MLGVKEALAVIFTIIRMITSLGLSVESFDINGFMVKEYTMIADMEYIQVEQRLSFDQMYGFETVDEMSKPNEIGFNGMFYNDIGKPAGILIIDGELIKRQSINTPLFIIRENGKLELIEPKLRTYLTHNNILYETYELNEGFTNTLISVFTKWYGPHNRRNHEHTVIKVYDNKVSEVFDATQSIKLSDEFEGINEGDFMVCYKNLKYDFPVNVGDKLEYIIETNFDYATVKEGFQTGGWLVKDGLNVAKDSENYIGYTTSLQPRTSIGITKDNKLVVKVVDGRNPGVSEGVTGSQLADMMIADGCINAAYLDGGASSTLVKDKMIFNEPSLGETKGVAHALYFYKKELK